jgi:hypothetical protein
MDAPCKVAPEVHRARQTLILFQGVEESGDGPVSQPDQCLDTPIRCYIHAAGLTPLPSIHLFQSNN